MIKLIKKTTCNYKKIIKQKFIIFTKNRWPQSLYNCDSSASCTVTNPHKTIFGIENEVGEEILGNDSPKLGLYKKQEREKEVTTRRVYD